MTRKQFKQNIEPLITAAKNVRGLYPADDVSITITPERMTIRVNDMEYEEHARYFCYGSERFEEESNDTV